MGFCVWVIFDGEKWVLFFGPGCGISIGRWWRRTLVLTAILFIKQNTLNDSAIEFY
jgi:hypothetical protein